MRRILSLNYRVHIYALVVMFTAIFAYLFGIYSYPRNIWPIELLRRITSTLAVFSRPTIGTFDEFGRLTAYPGKEEITCPTQNEGTAVILAIGQSNSANSGEKRFSTRHAEKVINYFNGKCYIAASPLLGASESEGEFMTPLADRLVKSGTYESVVIISSGISGSPLSRWQRDGDLNEMILTTIRNMRSDYRITEVIWHQGEKDFVNKTSAKNYVKSFNSLLETFSENKVNAPVFISIATKCGFDSTWYKDNPTAMGQRRLVDNKKIWLGVDTDSTLTESDRRADNCHFSESGQLKTAMSVATAIQKSR